MWSFSQSTSCPNICLQTGVYFGFLWLTTYIYFTDNLCFTMFDFFITTQMKHFCFHEGWCIGAIIKKASSVFGFLMPCLVLLKRPYLKHCGGLPKALWMTNKKCATNKKMNNNKNYEDLREPLQFSTKAAVNAAHIPVSFTSATIPINNANTSINIKNKHMAPYNCAAITCEISVALITMLS